MPQQAGMGQAGSRYDGWRWGDGWGMGKVMRDYTDVLTLAKGIYFEIVPAQGNCSPLASIL